MCAYAYSHAHTFAYVYTYTRMHSHTHVCDLPNVCTRSACLAERTQISGTYMYVYIYIHTYTRMTMCIFPWQRRGVQQPTSGASLCAPSLHTQGGGHWLIIFLAHLGSTSWQLRLPVLLFPEVTNRWKTIHRLGTNSNSRSLQGYIQ
jgi:hypothetical protein